MNSKALTDKCLSDGQTKAISEDEVVAYLRSNPDFFVKQADLLAEISLPHESGSAISLPERQINILRERGTEARKNAAAAAAANASCATGHTVAIEPAVKAQVG